MRKISAVRICSIFLGIYAGIIAIQHGVFEILQGSQIPNGLVFNAVGPPCQPEMVWHACFPAMTLIPNLFVTGLTAILVGVGMTFWSFVNAKTTRDGLIMGALSVIALLVGGGFVPVFIGFTSAVAKLGLGRRFALTHLTFLESIWPWPLVLMALWLPGSWMLGHFFNAAMVQAGGMLFLVFDLILPFLGLGSVLARNDR